MSKFSCSCLSYNGYLHISNDECYFTSSFFRVTFQWSNIKRVKLDTKHVKGVPTSVLVIGLSRIVGADGEDSSSTSSWKKKSKGASKKYFFYGFQDLLSAEERVKAAWQHWRQENGSASKEAPARKESEKTGEASGDDSDYGSTTAQQADDVESGGSTRAGAETPGGTSRTPPTGKQSLTDPADLRIGQGGATMHTRRSGATLPINRRHGGVDVLVPQCDSKFCKVAEPVLVDVARAFARGLHFIVQGGMLSTASLIFVICVLVVTISQTRATFSSMIVPSSDANALSETKRLLDTLHDMLASHRSLDQYTSVEEYHKSMQAREVGMETSTVWIHRLERSAKEMAQKYVLVQAEMLNLRARRASRFMAADMGMTSFKSDAWRRVFHEGDHHQRRYYLADPASADSEPPTILSSPRHSLTDTSGDAEEASNENGHSSSGRSHRRSLSLERVLDDVQFWRGVAQKLSALIRYTLPVGGAAARDLPGRRLRWSKGSFLGVLEDHNAEAMDLVRYSEPFLDGFDIVQYVTREEEMERRECLRISRELVKMSSLVEDVLLSFTSFLASHSYEAIAAGIERPHFWGTPPTPTTLLAASARRAPASIKGVPLFTSEEVLRVVFIRRYLEALLHLNPLEGNENRRRAESIEVSRRLMRFSEHDFILSHRMNRSSKDALQEAFYTMVLAPHLGEGSTTVSLRSTLRNPLEEMKFWEFHEELWMEHLLHSLPQAQQMQLRELARRRRAQAGNSANGAEKREKTKPNNDTKGDECAQGANATAEGRLNCRQRVFWKDLPIFRGLLCFTPQPHLHRYTPAGTITVARTKQRDVPREGTAAPAAAATPAVAATSAPAMEGTESSEMATYTGAQQQALEGAATDDSNAASLPPLRVPYARRFSRARTAEEEFRHIFDPGRVDNSVSTAKQRWMWELQMFLNALTPIDDVARVYNGGRRRLRALHLESEIDGVDTELARSRFRLLHLLDKINRSYLPPIQSSASGFLSFLHKWLWPPTWMRPFLWGERRNDDVDAIRAMATADPAVQLAAAQIVEVPWGTDSDAPLILLKNVLLQPPELLKLRIALHNRLMSSWLLFLIAVIALVVVSMFF